MNRYIVGLANAYVEIRPYDGSLQWAPLLCYGTRFDYDRAASIAESLRPHGADLIEVDAYGDVVSVTAANALQRTGVR